MTEKRTVDELLADWQTINPGQWPIADAVRKAVHEVYPHVAEKVMYGGILFGIDGKDFGGIFVYSEHSTLELSKGYLIEDPEKILEGTGKFRRHIKLQSREDIEQKHLKKFLQAAIL